MLISSKLGNYQIASRLIKPGKSCQYGCMLKGHTWTQDGRHVFDSQRW